MFSMKKEKLIRKSVRKNIAFYVSLALCISAVAGAAWTTYGSVQEYAKPETNSQESSKETSTLNAANEVSGQSYENSTVPESSVIEISMPEESKTESEPEKVKLLTPSIPEPVSEKSRADTPSNKVSKPIEKGDIIKAYSPKDPIRSETMNDWRTHSGVDISASDGSPVHAVLSGKVDNMYYDPLLGNVICIKSNGGYVLYYCGVTDTSIAKVGNEITSGETIGYIGRIPSEIKDEPHLHLEARINGDLIDPTILW